MKPGDVIGERFELSSVAGRGGMAAVWMARDHLTGERVALKALLARRTTRVSSLHEDTVEVDRFEREAALLARLDHPAIVRHVAHGVLRDGSRYLVMEWLDGEDLGKRLARGPLPPSDALALARRIAAALGTAHSAGIVHRDVKPANLFLAGGEPSQAKILDFGVARARLAERAVTATGTLLGTPGYMAPEQARGARDVDARADVFALGAVLFECLTGRPAFGGDHTMAVLAKVLFEEPPRPSDLVPGVPPAVDGLCAWLLAKQAERRPRDGATVAALLDSLPASDATPRSHAPPAASITSRERRLLSVVLAGSGADEPAVAAAETEMLPTIEQIGGTLDDLRAGVSALGGKLERLLDGSIAITLDGGAATTDQAARAARCALRARDLLPELCVSLATGWGTVAERWPMGEAIDRAVWLLRSPVTADATDHRRPIRIDEQTAALLEGRFVLGVDAGGRLLLGEDLGTDHGRTVLGRPTSCIGRERELALLTSLLDESAAEPVARAAIIVGAAGIGKSRLRREIARRLRQRERPTRIWIGRGDPVSAGAPFGMLADALRREAGLYGGEDVATARAHLSALVSRRVPAADRGRVTEFLGELVGVPFPDDESVELRAARADPMLMRDQILRAWEDLLDAESAAGPLVLMLEDLHWGDGPTVRFVDAALRRLADRPLAVLAFARPELHEHFPRLWEERSASILVVRELTRKASERLVREALGPHAGGALADAVVARVVERGQGNPFFIEELVRAVAGGDPSALPETVLAMVQARLDALDAPVRHVLRAASVFGMTFWRDGVLALVGRAHEVDGALIELVRREIASPRERPSGSHERSAPGGEHAFRHGILREAAYAMLTDADRTLGHRLAADWLERVGAGEPLALAVHFELGGEGQRAASSYRQAAEQALEGNDLAAAIAHAEAAIRCHPASPAVSALRLLEAMAHGWRGEAASSLARAAEARAASTPNSPTFVRALGEQAEVARATSDVPALLETKRILLATPVAPETMGPWIEAAAVAAAGLFANSEAAHGRELVERLDAADPELLRADPAMSAWVLTARSWLATADGDTGASLELDRRVVALYTEVGDLRNACLQRVSVAYDLVHLGAYAEAEAVLRDAIASAERLGLPRVQGVALHNLGLAAARQGRLDEAIALEEAAATQLATHKNRRLEAASRYYRARFLTEAGRLAEAEADARAAIALVDDIPSVLSPALATLARVLIGVGRHREALEAATTAHDLLVEEGWLDEDEALVGLTWIEALTACGDPGASDATTVCWQRLLLRAERIRDAEWRRRYLELVPENARLAELGRAAD